jgi:hypothetical protein
MTPRTHPSIGTERLLGLAVLGVTVWLEPDGLIGYQCPADVDETELRECLVDWRNDLVTALEGRAQPHEDRQPLADLDSAIGYMTFLPPGSGPTGPPRPESAPTLGLTVAGHVADLPRPARKAGRDPLHMVTGPGWPAWYQATEADHRMVTNPARIKTTVEAEL